MLDFRMDTFLTVCRCMNFTRAAKELNITQPAVSQHIRYLEDAYGVRLFHYQGKKLSLTAEGEALQNAALTMKHDLKYLKERMKGIRGIKKTLVFGATMTVAEFMIPDMLAGYLEDDPSADVRMRAANTRELLEELDGGGIDFALVEGYFEPGKYDCRLCRKENYIGVCAPGHRLAGLRDVSFKDIFGERLLIREPGSGSREILEKHLASENLSVGDFASVTQLGSIGAIKSLTARGAGVTFLYEAAVKKELAEGSLVKMELSDFKASHDISFLWRKGSIFLEEYKRMFELFRKQL